VAELRAAPAELTVLPTAEDVGRVAAERMIAVLARGIAENGVAHVALTGGSSCLALYRELRQPARRKQLDWSRVHMWWGDERYVPLDDPLSNAGLADRLLFAGGLLSGESGAGDAGTDVTGGATNGLPVDPHHVHPVTLDPTAEDAAAIGRTAAAYAAELRRWLPLSADGTPMFDVIFAGVGPDGHVMSIFPGSPALAPDAPIVMAVPAPQHVEPHLPRVTLAARVLGPAHQIVIMAIGGGKAKIVRTVLGTRRDPRRWPVQSALLPNAVWLLDREAAGAG
jgi:6-phosphogluconolactonase